MFGVWLYGQGNSPEAGAGWSWDAVLQGNAARCVDGSISASKNRCSSFSHGSWKDGAAIF